MQFVSAKGARMPALGLGTWGLTGRTCYEAVRAALDIGYRHIDTAQLYGNVAEVRAQGRTRFIGVSNFTVALLREAIEAHRADIVCNQVEYHPYLSQRQVMAAGAHHGLILTAYCPLGRGSVAADRDLERIGKAYGKTASQVALRWLLDQPNVAAIPKSARRKHLAANFAIFDFALSAADRAAIDAKRGTTRLVDPAGWAPDWDPA